MKISYEKDEHEVTKLSYKQMFKLSAKLIKKNDSIKKRKIDLKHYHEFLGKSNERLSTKFIILKT